MTWQRWFRILAWVLAELWRYLAGGDEQAAAARYRAACGHDLAAPAALGDLGTGDLIGMRTAAWEAGETGRAEAIDAELNRRLRDILRGRSMEARPRQR